MIKKQPAILKDLKILTECLRALALDAAEVLLSAYTDLSRGQRAVIKQKADGSPVTQADEKAESVIRSGLTRLYPEIPVVGEEGGASGGLLQSNSVFFLVDPLDGTKEFLARNDAFTVNIALIVGRKPVLGVVCAPALGEMFWYDGKRSFFASMTDLVLSDPVRLRVRSLPKEGATLLESRVHAVTAPSPRRSENFPNLPIAHRIPLGSSLKFCRIAQGLADFYPRLGPTMQWDTAAGQAVLSGAKGQVLRFPEALTLEYGPRFVLKEQEQSDFEKDAQLFQKEAFRNPFFFALGDRRILSLLGKEFPPQKGEGLSE